MSETKNEQEQQAKEDFKSSLKTTGLFGGVQIFKIILQIISAKFVAVLLGPTGMGISGLLGQTTGVISTFADLGLGKSAVRDMAEAYSSKDENRFFRTLSIFRRLVWGTGIIGLLICLLGSPLWSHITFGNSSYTWAFAILAITILLGQLSGGQGVIMQGTKHFALIAKSSVIGSVIGLFTSIPLYFWLGINGIVPAMIAGSVTGFLLTTYFSHKIPQKHVKVNTYDVFHEGKTMIQMGFLLMLQTFFVLLCGYLIRIYISHTGSLADVGMFSAGFSVINTYVGMVFNAMGTEYYPRLSTYSNDTKKFNQAINQQIEISLLLTAPLIALFLTFGDLVVILFYSKKFLPITWMINWAILAIFLKAPGWCTGYSYIAKGDSKVFWINELIASCITFSCNVIGYTYLGLTGLGLSSLVAYCIYITQNLIVTHWRYKFVLDVRILRAFIPQVLFSLVIVIVFATLGDIPRYIIGIIMACLSTVVSYKMLNKYVDVKAYIKANLHIK